MEHALEILTLFVVIAIAGFVIRMRWESGGDHGKGAKRGPTNLSAAHLERQETAPARGKLRPSWSLLSECRLADRHGFHKSSNPGLFPAVG